MKDNAIHEQPVFERRRLTRLKIELRHAVEKAKAPNFAA